jgi:DNA-binding phage protein
MVTKVEIISELLEATDIQNEKKVEAYFDYFSDQDETYLVKLLDVVKLLKNAIQSQPQPGHI